MSKAMKKQNSVYRLAIDAMLAAMCAALGYFSLDLMDFKFTFENLPILIGGIIFGPVDGMLIGFVGTFLYQLIRYGIEASTPLWIVPYVISGLIAGLGGYFCRKQDKYGFRVLVLVPVLLVNAALVTLMNTGSLYIYYKYILQIPVETMLLKLPVRLLVGGLKAVVYVFAIPALLTGLEKAHILARPGEKS